MHAEPGPSYARNRAGIGQAVYFPAGVYLVTRPLTVHNSREGCDPGCQGGPDCVHDCHPPARFFGDGMEQSVIKANRSISAVLLFNSSGQVKAGAPSYLTQKHQVDSMSFDGGFLANYSVYGKGIVQSQFRASGFRKHPAYCASNAALSM